MLRDYQQAAVDAAISWHKYKDTPAIIEVATGGGKSHIIAALAEHYYHLGKRVAIIAHRKRLLEQNGAKLSVPHGYCSASLGDSNIDANIIVGGIQTIVNRNLPVFDVVIIDECHRVPNNTEISQYWEFIGKNAGCLVIGLSATPYRLDGGKLSWGEIVYSAKYPLLLKDGYLAPITNKVKNTPDLSKVKLVAGEYNSDDLSTVMEDPALIDAATQNILAYGSERNSTIIFCVTVAHAKALASVMQANGMQCATIHAKTPEAERDVILDDFCAGRLRYLLNCEMLIEGFDAPRTDMLVSLRSTKSKALWEQMLGRIVRLFEGKRDAFLLDMSGNLMEHGGLGSPYFEKSKRESQKKPGRICPECETFNAANAKECVDCGYVFLKDEPIKASHNYDADTNGAAVYDHMIDYDVKDVFYREHVKRKTGAKSLRVDYHCPAAKYGTISEYLSTHHENEWVRGKAHKFFKDRGKDIYGDIKDYAISDLIFFAENYLKKPTAITVDHSGEFPRIMRYVYDENRKSNTEGAGEVASDLLEGDSIPF